MPSAWREVLLGHAEHLVHRRDAVAVRPIAAEKNAILAEDLHQQVEPAAVGLQVGRDRPLNAVNDRGQLDIHLRTGGEVAQHGLERNAIGRGVERRERRQVIKHYPKRRHLVGDAQDSLQQREARIGGIHDEIRLREPLQPVDERRHPGLRREIPPPQIAATNAPEQGILAIAAEVLGKLRLLGLEVADDRDDHGVLLCHLEHPQVVLDPRARLDLDRPDGAERRGKRAIARRKRGHRRPRRFRTAIGRTLRAIRIEQMNVGVDDGDRGRLSGVDSRRNHRRCDSGQEVSTLHHPCPSGNFPRRWRKAQF